MRLIALDAEPFHQISNQPVIVFTDLVTAIFFRPEIARNTQLVWVVEGNARPFIRHALGDDDVGVQALPSLAVEMDETAHSVEEASGNGQA